MIPRRGVRCTIVEPFAWWQITDPRVVNRASSTRERTRGKDGDPAGRDAVIDDGDRLGHDALHSHHSMKGAIIVRHLTTRSHCPEPWIRGAWMKLAGRGGSRP